MKKTKNDRRHFIKSSSLAVGSVLFSKMAYSESHSLLQQDSNKVFKFSELKQPLAIAMWDFSWILRHHRYGEFENWDKVLSELLERGYNAIRIDAMPQFVAADTDGSVANKFRSVKEDWKPAVWGNDCTMSFSAREALLEFLPKCEKHGIKVGLASWFMRHGTNRQDIFNEKGGLLRA